MKHLESKVNCFDALDLYFFPYISYSNCGVGFPPDPMGCTEDNNICGLYNFLLCLVLIAFNVCTTGNLSINFNSLFLYSFSVRDCKFKTSFVVGFYCHHSRRNTQILNYYDR